MHYKIKLPIIDEVFHLITLSKVTAFDTMHAHKSIQSTWLMINDYLQSVKLVQIRECS